MNQTQNRVALPATLSRWQLTLALISVTLLPFGLVVWMWYSIPKGKEPVLIAEVKVGPAAWPVDATAVARTVPCVELRNPTSDRWENVSLALNEQYFFYHPVPILGGDEIRIPLQHFRTKGNQDFAPDVQVLKQITVFAQLPSGARAVLEVIVAE